MVGLLYAMIMTMIRNMISGSLALLHASQAPVAFEDFGIPELVDLAKQCM